MIHLLWLIPLAFLSGLFGRMGGAGKSGQWYEKILDTKWRDWGCSLIVVIATLLVAGGNAHFWWAYLLIFVLSWGAFATYWDWAFGGEDNLGFSGVMVGLAWAPVLFIKVKLWPVVVLRIVVLGLVWWALNQKLPQGEGRDVKEEYWRYFISL